MKLAKKIIGIAAWAFIACVLLFAVLFLVTNVSGKIFYLGNYSFIRIVSPSMEPEIMKDDYILIRKTAADEVEVGDVIVFTSRDSAIYGMFNTHRVVEKTDGSDGNVEFVTKGDNNIAVDSVRAAGSDVSAKYVRVLPGLTALAKMLQNKAIFFALIITPAGILVLMSVWDVIKRAREYKTEMLVQQEVERLKKENNSKDDTGDSDNV